MSAAGATGPAATEGNVAVPAALTPTELETEESCRQASRRAARIFGSPTKTDDGAVNDVAFGLSRFPKKTLSEPVESLAKAINPQLGRPSSDIADGTMLPHGNNGGGPPRMSSSAAEPFAGLASNTMGNSTLATQQSDQQAGANVDQAADARVDSLRKPIPILPTFANIPAQLTSLANWVLWRYLPPKSDGQKWRKVPFQPKGKTADTTDRSTWSRFEECCAAYTRGGFDGVGFVFDGEIGADGLCYCGVDFDACSIENGKAVHSLALSRIKRLDTYTECSVSGTGIHCIARAKPLDRIVKFDGVEIYTKARYFTFTGRSLGKIKAAPSEISALADEVRAKQAAANQQQQSSRSGPNGIAHNDTDPFKNAKPAQAFAALAGSQDHLSDGLKDTWFETLPPTVKDEVVDYALGIISKNTPLLELEADGGNNAEYYKLTTSVARSDAPNAEEIFIKYASRAKNADPDEALRQHFSRCRASQPSGNREITVGTLLLLAQQNGANFDQWKSQAPCVIAPPLITWPAAGLQVSFSNIPHRHWVYGTYLIRGEITYEAAPGGVGKTAHSIAMAVEIATGTEVLGEKIWGNNLKVLYINAEDGRDEINRRVQAFYLAHAQKLTGQNFARLLVLGVDDPRIQSLSFLTVNEKGATVLNRAGIDVLGSALETLRPDVLILDPLVAFCGGGNMNDNAVMALVSRELKRLAAKFNCAILINHHTRKGSKNSDPGGEAEEISGASSIVNLARRALTLKTMTEEEAKLLGVYPSEQRQYLKLVDAKSNLAPRSADTPWYRLHSVELPNPEPPVYPHGDNVQAIARVQLPLPNNAAATADEQKIRRAILDLVDRGKMIDGQSYPYSPSLAGAKNERSLLDDAKGAVASATASRQWPPGDLKAATERTIAKMKEEGLLVEGLMPGKGRFRKGRALRTDRSRISSPDTGSDGSAPSGDLATSHKEEEKGVDKSAVAERPAEMKPADKAAARAAAAERKAKGDNGGQLVNSRAID